MTDFVTATTKLEATNYALKEVGFTQVGTLDGVIGRDAALAVTSIDNEVRSLCRKGLWFARRDLALTPNEDGFLLLPSNVLSITKPDPLSFAAPWSEMAWREERPTMRQQKVYSIYRQSYVFTQALTVGINEVLPFEDIPDEARAYVQVFAALALNRSYLRSEDVEKRLTPLLNSSWLSLVDADIENSNYRFI